MTAADLQWRHSKTKSEDRNLSAEWLRVDGRVRL